MAPWLLLVKNHFPLPEYVKCNRLDGTTLEKKRTDHIFFFNCKGNKTGIKCNELKGAALSQDPKPINGTKTKKKAKDEKRIIKVYLNV